MTFVFENSFGTYGLPRNGWHGGFGKNLIPLVACNFTRVNLQRLNKLNIYVYRSATCKIGFIYSRRRSEFFINPNWIFIRRYVRAMNVPLQTVQLYFTVEILKCCRWIAKYVIANLNLKNKSIDKKKMLCFSDATIFKKKKLNVRNTCHQRELSSK